MQTEMKLRRRGPRPIGFALMLFLGLAAMTPQCNLASIAVETPTHGEYTTATSVTVQGTFKGIISDESTEVRVNGGPAQLDVDERTFSAVVPIDREDVFNRIVVELIHGDPPEVVRTTTVTVIAVDGTTTGPLPEGALNSEGVVMRLNNTGLGQIGPVIESLSSEALDVGDLITSQNPVLDDECVIEAGSGCLFKATVNAVEVGFGSFGLDAAASGPSSVDTTIPIEDFFVEIDMRVRDVARIFDFTCGLELMADAASIGAAFDLQPDEGDARFVDVNQKGPPSIGLDQFSYRFISGICDNPIIGDIIDRIVGKDLEALVTDGFAARLGDPDGSGPLDSPIAEAIQMALADVAIAGPVGDAIGAMLDAPFSSIIEDSNGVSLIADAAITQPNPLGSAPDLGESFAVLGETPPAFGELSPSGLPYGLAFAISMTSLNQMIQALIEGGLLRLELAEIEVPGLGPIALNVGVLSALIPNFEKAGDPLDPVTIKIRPRLSPVFTPSPGPNGEQFDLKIGALRVEFFVRKGGGNAGTIVLVLDVNLRTGVDLAFTENGLEFNLGNPDPESLDAQVITDTLGIDPGTFDTALQGILPFLTGPLSDAIEAFPIPGLLGLDLDPVELARVDSWVTLFANLNEVPTTEIRNLMITDLSDPDFRKDSLFDVSEWRHRVSGTASAREVNAALKGFIGADACCTTGDETAVAEAEYEIQFDVASVPNEEWQIDLAHSILGAYDLKDDSVLLEDAGGFAEFRRNGVISASYTTSTGDAGSFDFVVEPVRVDHPIRNSRDDTYVEFFGAKQTTISGTGDTTVTLSFAFEPRARSDSNLLFPAAGGDKVGIRFGKSSTIDNHFPIGGYPGTGNRDIAADGHKVSVILTTTPMTGSGVCGDGTVDVGEACDDGANDGGEGQCLPGCLSIQFCGDGRTEGTELCDDGVNDGTGPLGCSAGCNPPPAACGNGMVEAGEVCELGDTIDCAELGGFASGTAPCDSSCSAWDTMTCTVEPATCTVAYDLSAVLEITDTLFGLGDATQTGLVGSLVLEYSDDGADNIQDGPVGLLHYWVLQDFAVASSITVTTKVHSFAPSCNAETNPTWRLETDPGFPVSCNPTGNTVAVASGTLDLTAGSITWDACNAATDYWAPGTEDYSPSDESSGPGCLADLKSIGNVNCDGVESFCDLGNLAAGDNPQATTWTQPLINGTEASGSSAIAVSGGARASGLSTPTGAGGGFQSFNIPNDTPSRTWLSWTATRDDSSPFTTCN